MRVAIFFLLPFFVSSISMADDLEPRLAKARGDKSVTEQASGYLKALSDSPGIKALVEEVNKKRKEKYQEVSTKAGGASLDTVEQSAGKQLMEKYNK